MPLDDAAFPAISLAREVGARGGTAPAVYNAANEECVEAFLGGRLPFLAIVDTVAQVVAEHAVSAGPAHGGNAVSVDDVLAAEAWARARAGEITR